MFSPKHNHGSQEKKDFNKTTQKHILLYYIKFSRTRYAKNIKSSLLSQECLTASSGSNKRPRETLITKIF